MANSSLYVHDESALDVVVYAAPGPPDHRISDYSHDLVQQARPCRVHRALGYVVLVPSDFERLWSGILRGDLHGAAFDTLRCLGGDGGRFLEHPLDWVYAWIGREAEPYGRVLLLQVFRGTSWGAVWN